MQNSKTNNQLLTNEKESIFKKIYSYTIDRSGFREIASRYIVFILPIIFWGRKPHWEGLYIIALGLILRTWAAGHLYKDENVARSGPYLLFRHPLYLGSCLFALGIIVIMHHWVVTLILGTITALTYFHNIRHEEQNLLKRFGENYKKFMDEVGPFWPKPKGIKAIFDPELKKQRKRFSWKQFLKNKEYECWLGVLFALLLLWLGENKFLGF
jgi:hypothetical protein